MRKSSQISLGLLAAVAMAFTSGCRRPEAQNCVGADNRIVGDQFCQETDQQRRNNPSAYYPYRWVFGGSSGGHLGDSVFGGSASPSSGAASGVSRGGFGSSLGSGGHSSGGGE